MKLILPSIVLKPFFPAPPKSLPVDSEIQLLALRSCDAKPLYHLVENNRAYLEAWLPWAWQMQQVSDLKRFIKKLRFRDVYSGRMVFGIWFRDELVGLIDFNEGDRSLQKVGVGYWIAKSYQGMGIVTRAVQRWVDHVFETETVQKVHIKCATTNKRSQAVAQRLGFTLEHIEPPVEILPGVHHSFKVFALTYRSWHDQQWMR
jgi:ribosomal-protein-serine acetyltransferase